MCFRTFWERFGHHATAIGTLAEIALVLLACWFFFIEQNNVDQREREARSLEFSTHFHSDAVIDADRRLTAIALVDLEVVTSPKKLHPEVWRDGIARAFAKDPMLYHDLIVMVQAYELSMECMKANLCDSEVMDTFIIPTAAGFYQTFEPQIDQIKLRFNREDFAMTLESHTESPRSR